MDSVGNGACGPASDGGARAGRPAVMSRRSVTRGLAWAAPVVTLAGAVPAFASSAPPPGLQGWVTVNKECGSIYTENGVDYRPITGIIEGNTEPQYPAGQYGLYVYNATPAQVSNAYIVFYLPSNMTDVVWNQTTGTVSPDTLWSVPLPDASAPAISGFNAYRSSYSGGWTASGSTAVANGQPRFRGTGRYVTGAGYCSSNGLTVWARRCVTVNSIEICFTRSVTL